MGDINGAAIARATAAFEFSDATTSFFIVVIISPFADENEEGG
jgi:hypothetical protein